MVDVAERDRIELFDWLVQQYLEMDFSPEDAELLAACDDVDYRDAKALIRQGCPHLLALQILL